MISRRYLFILFSLAASYLLNFGRTPHHTDKDWKNIKLRHFENWYINILSPFINSSFCRFLFLEAGYCQYLQYYQVILDLCGRVKNKSIKCLFISLKQYWKTDNFPHIIFKNCFLLLIKLNKSEKDIMISKQCCSKVSPGLVVDALLTRLPEIAWTYIF